MAQWETMTHLFDMMREMAAEMASTIPDDHCLLGESTNEIATMMPLYGPGSPGGRVDDLRTRDELVDHLRAVGNTLKGKVASASDDVLNQPQSTPFLSAELPTVGDLLGHVYTTHIALHMGQLSQIRRELGLPSLYQF